MQELFETRVFPKEDKCVRCITVAEDPIDHFQQVVLVTMTRKAALLQFFTLYDVRFIFSVQQQSSCWRSQADLRFQPSY